MPETFTALHLVFAAFAVAANLFFFGLLFWALRSTAELLERQRAFMDRAEAHFEVTEAFQARLLEALEEARRSASSQR